MSTTTDRVIFESDKGNYFVETLIFDETSSNTIVCEKLIFTTDANLTDTHSVTARHKRSKKLLIKGRL